METGNVEGSIIYLRSVDEIYDVRVMPNMTRANIVRPEKEVSRIGITSPEFSFWKVPKEEKK